MKKEDIINRINELKKEKNAIILAHYYVNSEIQEIADYLGDSYKLAMDAAKTDAKIIVFAGVHFMGETAKIMSPEKKVLMPDINAGCRMANMINENLLKKYKDEHPNTKVISYVNTTAKVKALSDCCCTSSNALKIIKYYTDQNYDILYCPDQNLGKYAMEKFGKEFDVWSGFCPMHHLIDVNNLKDLMKKNPNAKLIAHPECTKEVVKMASYVGSTKQLLDFTKADDAKEYIVATEEGIIHQMQKQNPDKKFIVAGSTLYCPNMKKNTLEKILNVLEKENNEIILDDDLMKDAKKSLDEMFRITNL